MKKKKKKKEDTYLHFFLPSIKPTINPMAPVATLPDIEELKQSAPQMSMLKAYFEYTGIPSMIGGGLGALGFNVALQAGQVRSGTSIFSAARFGFGTALLLEAGIGTLIFAAFLTLVDPEDLYAGGLDITYEEMGEYATKVYTPFIQEAVNPEPITNRGRLNPWYFVS